jgi:endonuclease/exonuclease/phosphatase family metal-dependent hydrolase
MRILFSNLGYATGINGTLRQHAGKVFRHAFQTTAMQHKILAQFNTIIEATNPDLCCLVELDQGSFHSGYFNQMKALISAQYPIYDIADKYGPQSHLSGMLFHRGKSNGFLAKKQLSFERLYFEHGTKRLIYKIQLREELTLFFAHFSLTRKIRAKQFVEMKHLIEATAGDVLVMGDFNTLTGLGELKPLVEGDFLTLLNSPDMPTFRFHRWHHILDLCFVSPTLAPQCQLEVIAQPFSDHEALLLEISLPPPKSPPCQPISL